MTQLPAAGFLFGLLAATAAAQTSIVLPPEYERAWGHNSSSTLGGNSTRTQMIFAQPVAPGTTIVGFGLRQAPRVVDLAAFVAEIEIRCSSTAAAPGALSETFANNIGSDEVVVLPRRTVIVPAAPANRSTGDFAEFEFTNPFVFGTNSNPNLCIELLVYGRANGAMWSTDRGFATPDGSARDAGIGCGPATIELALANAPPNTFATLLPSLDQKECGAGQLLPFPLSNYGGNPACAVLVGPTLGPVSYLTDATGAASHAFVVPPGIGRLGVGWQWSYLVPPTASNPLGLETTASHSTWIGPEVIVPHAQYVWNLFDVGATTGDAGVDSVPVVKLVTQ